jgi:hypothetical protein
VREIGRREPIQGAAKMHDILIALAFVAMVACPAIVASMQKPETDEEI